MLKINTKRHRNGAEKLENGEGTYQGNSKKTLAKVPVQKSALPEEMEEAEENHRGLVSSSVQNFVEESEENFVEESEESFVEEFEEPGLQSLHGVPPLHDAKQLAMKNAFRDQMQSVQNHVPIYPPPGQMQSFQNHVPIYPPPGQMHPVQNHVPICPPPGQMQPVQTQVPAYGPPLANLGTRNYPTLAADECVMNPKVMENIRKSGLKVEEKNERFAKFTRACAERSAGGQEYCESRKFLAPNSGLPICAWTGPVLRRRDAKKLPKTCKHGQRRCDSE